MATPRPLLMRWLVVLLALFFASVTVLHDGAHAGPTHLAPDIAMTATADHALYDCDRDGEHTAKGEHCAAVTVCKFCIPVAEATAPRIAASSRHVWRGDSFSALSVTPHQKPPKLFVRA